MQLACLDSHLGLHLRGLPIVVSNITMQTLVGVDVLDRVHLRSRFVHQVRSSSSHSWDALDSLVWTFFAIESVHEFALRGVGTLWWVEQVLLLACGADQLLECRFQLGIRITSLIQRLLASDGHL